MKKHFYINSTEHGLYMYIYIYIWQIGISVGCIRELGEENDVFGNDAGHVSLHAILVLDKVVVELARDVQAVTLANELLAVLLESWHKDLENKASVGWKK